MRILHTSDWHLGQELYNYRREDEHQHFFSQLTDIVTRQQPDVMVVSGDIFHTPTPSAAARKLYNEGLLQVQRACPQMTTVITAGNHDSAARLEVDSSLWRYFNVHVVGALRRDAQTVHAQEHIISVPDKGFIVAVPHVYPHNVPFDSADGDRMKALFTLLLQETERLNTQQLPVVVMAHMAVEGCDITGHQNYNDSVGGMDFVSADVFNGHYDYVALGHIHRGQGVPLHNPRIRYSGTPLAVHFDEAYQHAVSVVDVEYGATPQVVSIPVEPLRPLLTIPDQPVDFDEALHTLSGFSDDTEAYIRLFVNLNDGLPPDAAERAAKAAEGKACRFCTFKRFDNRQHTARQDHEDISPDQFREMTPLEVAGKYLEQKGFSAEKTRLFVDMMGQVVKQMNAEIQ